MIKDTIYLIEDAIGEINNLLKKSLWYQYGYRNRIVGALRALDVLLKKVYSCQYTNTNVCRACGKQK